MEKGKEIFRVQRKEIPPKLIFDPDVSDFSKKSKKPLVKLSWNVGPTKDKGSLYHYLSYSTDGGKHFRPLGMRRQAANADINLANLPGGDDCRLRVRVTDGMNTVEATSKPFSRPWMGPMTEIHWPQDGEAVKPGSYIEVNGQGFSNQESFPDKGKLQWSVNGKVVSTQQQFILKIPENAKSVAIELKVADSMGKSDSVVHTVNVIE